MLYWLILSTLTLVVVTLMWLLRWRWYTLQARSLLHRGKADRALTLLTRAVAINRHDPESWLLLAKSFSALKRYEEAPAPFRQALLLNPDKAAEIHFHLGLVFAAMGERADAIDAFKENLRLEPRHAMGFTHLGEQFLLKGEANHAAEAVQRALDLAPTLEPALALKKTLDSTRKSA